MLLYAHIWALELQVCHHGLSWPAVWRCWRCVAEGLHRSVLDTGTIKKWRVGVHRVRKHGVGTCTCAGCRMHVCC